MLAHTHANSAATAQPNPQVADALADGPRAAAQRFGVPEEVLPFELIAGACAIVGGAREWREAGVPKQGHRARQVPRGGDKREGRGAHEALHGERFLFCVDGIFDERGAAGVEPERFSGAQYHGGVGGAIRLMEIARATNDRVRVGQHAEEADRLGEASETGNGQLVSRGKTGCVAITAAEHDDKAASGEFGRKGGAGTNSGMAG